MTRTSPRPKPVTQSNPGGAMSSYRRSKRARSVPHISVSALLPLSIALLLTLAPAVPGATATVEPPAENGLETLRTELATARAEVTSARERVEGKIGLYLEEAERLEEATEARKAAERRSHGAVEYYEDRRLSAARQAAAAYKGADPDVRNAWTGPEGPSGLLERAAYLTLLGEHRFADLGRAEAARVAADTLVGTAGTAERQQIEATEAAEEARDTALEAIDEQEERARGLLEEQSVLEASLAEEREGLEVPEEIQKHARTTNTPEEPARVPPASTESQDSSEEGTEAAGPGDCATGDPFAFENGRAPNSVLCPLSQPGEALRADAADAFVELDGAYRTEFDRPLCVTDSYRPYHEQVRLFQEMSPGMAARPGTSAHGLGIAVDLCGGVHEVGATEHRWMLANGPDHGWDNPHWARDGFEPWHWEYAPPPA